MKKTIYKRLALMLVVVFAGEFVVVPNVAYGENFSCSYGKRGACLDYSDKVCSSFAKCVSDDAVCFDSYTCGYKGFICKSKYDNLANEYDNLYSKHNNIVSEYNDLLYEHENKISQYTNFQSCVSYASSLEEAQSCY